MVRVASANIGNTLLPITSIDHRLDAKGALDRVEWNLDLYERMIHRAAEDGAEVVVFSEDTLCLGGWECAQWETPDAVLPRAVQSMIRRLGGTAASHRMYLVCASDVLGQDGKVRNTAFLLGRDGKEVGRYHKVGLPMTEHLKTHGDSFPVFATPDLGGVGLLICYDLVFPETARCLALNGAHIIFDPTHGGAAFGGAEISLAAFRTRAVENFTWLVVSWGGWGSDTGSLIISPRGEVVAEEKRGGGFAIADIDPLGGRRNQDWSNEQADMRTRLFRERRPSAYGALTQASPPVLSTLPEPALWPPERLARQNQRAATVGHGQYERAEKLAKAGKVREAIAEFEKLAAEYPASWFDRTARARIAQLGESGG